MIVGGGGVKCYFLKGGRKLGVWILGRDLILELYGFDNFFFFEILILK